MSWNELFFIGVFSLNASRIGKGATMRAMSRLSAGGRLDSLICLFVEIYFVPAVVRRSVFVESPVFLITPGATLEAESALLEHTLVMAGDIIPAGTCWQGSLFSPFLVCI